MDVLDSYINTVSRDVPVQLFYVLIPIPKPGLCISADASIESDINASSLNGEMQYAFEEFLKLKEKIN